MAIVVRPPEPPDVDDLARINIAAWRSAYTGIVPDKALDEMTFPLYQRRWRRNLAGEHPRGARFLVGMLDDVLASYAIFGPYRTQQDAPPDEDVDDWGELFAIYTDPGLQGRGVGGRVHGAALGALAAAGHAEVALWVLRANERTRAWYARKGWYADGATSFWAAKGTELPELRLRHPAPASAARARGTRLV